LLKGDEHQNAMIAASATAEAKLAASSPWRVATRRKFLRRQNAAWMRQRWRSWWSRYRATGQWAKNGRQADDHRIGT